MELSREIVPHLLLAASGQLHNSSRRNYEHDGLQCLMAMVKRLLESQEERKYVYKHECMLLTEKLVCTLKMALRSTTCDNERMFQELHGIVTCAAALINLCDCQVSDAHPYRLISLSQSKEAFAVVLSRLAWFATEFLIRRDFLGILRQVLADMWQLELKDTARDDRRNLLSDVEQERLLQRIRPTIMYIKESEIEVKFERAIGLGAFGKVYKAKWQGEWCAFKEFGSSNDATFKREGEVLASLHHPNIVQFIGCFKDDRSSALVMELMDYDLTFLFRDPDLGKDLIVAVDLMLQTAEGMKYLHAAGIVHRDLKPANILIKKINKSKQSKVGYYAVKLTDFGLARTKFKSMETLWSYKVGTLRYRAPELLENISEERLSTDPTTPVFPKKGDVYSFAITCSEILTSKKPYSDLEHTATELPTMVLRQEILKGRRPLLPSSNHCPQQLISLIERCWDKNPDQRPNFDIICVVLQQIKAFLLAEQNVALQPSRGFNGILPFDNACAVHEAYQFQHVSYSALRL